MPDGWMVESIAPHMNGPPSDERGSRETEWRRERNLLQPGVYSRRAGLSVLKRTDRPDISTSNPWPHRSDGDRTIRLRGWSGAHGNAQFELNRLSRIAHCPRNDCSFGF